jgi:hypothetical protein
LSESTASGDRPGPSENRAAVNRALDSPRIPRYKPAMGESNRPYLIDLICSLADNGVAFVICGGMAAVYHGVERMTMDLDISLDMDPENVKRFLKTALELGLEPRAPVPAESLMDPATVRRFVEEKNARVFTFWDPESPYRQIDVFLTDDQAYSLLKDHTVPARVDGRSVKVLSVKKLLELKKRIQNPRDKDRLDIEALIRMTGGEM